LKDNKIKVDDTVLVKVRDCDLQTIREKIQSTIDAKVVVEALPSWNSDEEFLKVRFICLNIYLRFSCSRTRTAS
jgi:hypothetical protein